MKKFCKGFVYAWNGICISSRERNMRVHFVAMALVLLFGLYVHLSQIEWTIIILAIGLVLAAEGFNTAFEYVINLIRDDCHVPYENVNLGKAKDIAAGAVLACAIAAACAGAVIFVPHLLRILW